MARYQIRMAIVVEVETKEEAIQKGKKLEKIFNKETHLRTGDNTRVGILHDQKIWSNQVLEVLPYDFN